MATRRSAQTRRAAPGNPGGRFGAFGLLVYVLLLSPTVVAAQFAVHPVQVTLDAAEQVGTETITVENQGGEVLELQVYLNDFDRVTEGGHAYFPFGDHARSCAGRLEVFPDQLTLAAEENGEIRVRLQPGTATCWGMIFVERRTLTPSGITVAHRIGVKVFGRGDGTVREGQVLGLVADTTAEPAALLAFASEGDVILDVTGEIEIRDLAGSVLGVVEMEPFRVLPGRQRRMRVPLTDVTLEPGQYLLVAILDFGADYLAGGQAMLEVEP